jgi:hypothetical protein
MNTELLLILVLAFCVGAVVGLVTATIAFMQKPLPLPIKIEEIEALPEVKPKSKTIVKKASKKTSRKKKKS